MSFDGIVTRSISIELNEKLKGAKIDKIYQPERDEIIIGLRTISDYYKLLMTASSSNPRIHLTNQKKENPITAPLFCMILRKHLQGGKILSTKQIFSDRIIEIEIESYTELGDLTVKRLIIEIMGRHSNIILVSEKNTIIDSIKHIDFTVSSVRQILPGLIYEYPPLQDKISPDCFTVEKIKEILDTKASDTTFEKAIVSSVTGISPQLAREIAFRANKTINTPLINCNIEKLTSETISFFDNVKNNRFLPTLVYDSTKKHPESFSCVELTQYYPLPVYSSESISEIIDKFYEERSQNERINQKSAGLIKIINNNIDRCKKKIQLHKQNIEKSTKRDKYKTYGDLLVANLYKVNYGDKTAIVTNYFSENQEDIEIPLKPDLSPSQNAQHYYKLFNKAKTTEEYSIKELEKTENELYYLETVLESLSLSKTASDIDEIKEELAQQGYINIQKKKNKKNTQKPRPFEFRTSDGYTVYVGRNNIENDWLTLKSSYSTDIWLHTKFIPGSHTIIKTKGETDIPDSTIIEAATLAAYHSKAKKSAQVPVDYTIIKNVKKPKGAKPGFVIYDYYNTVYVTPSEEIVDKLRV